MANVWNERRRKLVASRQKSGTVITRSQLIEILRIRGMSLRDIEQIVKDLPFDEQYLVTVRFDRDQIHMGWKPKKFPLTA